MPSRTLLLSTARKGVPRERSSFQRAGARTRVSGCCYRSGQRLRLVDAWRRDALAQQDWTRARPLALAGGVAVQFALAIERRGVRLRRTPSTKGGRSFVVQIAASGLVLLAGAGLVGIGAISKRHGWWPIGVAAVIPLLAVLGAAILNRRVAAIRLAKAARAQPWRARLGTRWQKLRGGKPHV